LGVDQRLSRREALARMASASAALAGSGLDALAAQQPCADGAAAGTLIGTLPLSRADGVIQPYGVKFGGWASTRGRSLTCRGWTRTG
jgi:hypothetical protein